jgi:glycerol 2-dehydrogenase (NADP+)
LARPHEPKRYVPRSASSTCADSVEGNHPLFPKLEDGSRDIDHSITHIQTWQNMEKLIQSNPDKVKAIGVANYSVKYMEKLLAKATIVPAANQIENHPLLPQQEVVDFCKSKGIHITAYSPLGSTGSPLFKDEGILEVAKKHNVGPATVLLSYHRKFYFLSIPSTLLTTHQLPAALPSSPNP